MIRIPTRQREQTSPIWLMSAASRLTSSTRTIVASPPTSTFSMSAIVPRGLNPFSNGISLEGSFPSWTKPRTFWNWPTSALKAASTRSIRGLQPTKTIRSSGMSRSTSITMKRTASRSAPDQDDLEEDDPADRGHLPAVRESKKARSSPMTASPARPTTRAIFSGEPYRCVSAFHV